MNVIYMPVVSDEEVRRHIVWPEQKERYTPWSHCSPTHTFNTSSSSMWNEMKCNEAKREATSGAAHVWKNRLPQNTWIELFNGHLDRVCLKGQFTEIKKTHIFSFTCGAFCPCRLILAQLVEKHNCSVSFFRNRDQVPQNNLQSSFM